VLSEEAEAAVLLVWLHIDVPAAGVVRLRCLVFTYC
jgi:hypothetical protein